MIDLENMKKGPFTVEDGKVKDYEFFKDDVSIAHEQSFDEVMYAIKLNRASKAELKRREAEKTVNEVMEHLFDEFI